MQDKCAIRKKSEIQNAIQYIVIEPDQSNNMLYEIENFFKNTDYLREPHKWLRHKNLWVSGGNGKLPSIW